MVMCEAESGRLYFALFHMLEVDLLLDICQNFRSGGTRPPGAKPVVLIMERRAGFPARQTVKRRAGKPALR